MKSEDEISDIYNKLKSYRDKVDGYERARVNHYLALLNYIFNKARKDNSLIRIMEQKWTHTTKWKQF